MDLSQVSDHEILIRMEKLARTERKITHLILWHINEVASRKLYAKKGYSSLHKYLVEHLGYADDSAYRREQAARVLRQVPEVAKKIESGAINLTQLTQVQKCLKQERKAGHAASVEFTTKVLEQIQDKNNYETQKVLATEFQLPIFQHEVVRPQRDETVRLEITVTEEQMRKIRQAKDLLSHVLYDGSWAELITLLAEKHIQKELGKELKSCQLKMDSGRESTENSLEKSAKKKSKENLLQSPVKVVTSHSNSVTPRFSVARKHIKVTTRRELLLNAGYCCEYRDSQTGRRCQSSYQLQIDHKIPLACGGNDRLSNYRILCRTHNLLEARRWGLKSNF